ncbi:MAG: GNAT family protein [Lachnospiraceae bacterium]|nr:GNAT family protein [Lachnospiraceae bacterium]
MRIRPYISIKDYDVIKEWILDERTNAMWCANLIKYPLEKALFESVLLETSIKFGDSAYVATTDDGKVIGFFCYSINLTTNEGMLKFVMVNNECRGKGIGKEMLRLAVKYAFEITKADAVQLNVFSENVKAKKCYLNVGFIERTTTKNAFSFYDELWGRCNMVLKKEC